MAEPKPNRPPNGVVRVALQGTTDTATWANVFWLNAAYTGTPTGAQLLALSNAVSAAYRTRFGPQLSPSWQVKTQRAVLYVSSTLEIAVDGADTGSGSGSGTNMTSQCCYLVNWSISGSYRGGHPRTYFSGVTSAGTGSPETVSTGTRTALTTAANNFIADVNALTPTPFSSVQLGTVRFFRNLSALAPPVFEPYLAGSCSPILATQRRRLRR